MKMEEVKQEVSEVVVDSPRNSFQEALRAILKCLGIESVSGNTCSSSALEKKEDKAGEPIDKQQKADETSCQQLPESTMEQPVDPPMATTDPTDDDPSSTTDQPMEDSANIAATTLAAGRAPPRPGFATSNPQNN